MASAGQAHAHSSQPMHFSSPSGQRLSWCLPWNLGATGRGASGYSAVSTFLNIWWKVTPKPLTGLRKSSTGDLLAARGRPGPVVMGQVQRRDGEARRLPGRLGLVVGEALKPGPAALGARLPGPDDGQEQ